MEPKPKLKGFKVLRKTITLRLDEKTHKQLKIHVIEMETSAQHWIMSLIIKALDEAPNEK